MKVIKQIVTVVLAIVLFCSVVFSAAFGVLNFTVYKTDYYTKTIITDEFIAELRSHIEEIVRRQTMLYEIDAETVIAQISDKELTDLANEDIPKVVNYLLYNTEFELTPYQNENIKQTIQENLDAFAAENGLEVEEGAVDEAYLAICNTISINASVFPQSYLNKVPSVAKYLKLLSYWYIGIITAVVSAAVIVLLNRKKFASALYSLFTATWLAGAVTFIPLVMLAIYNFPSRLALAKSPMKMFIDSVFNGVLASSLWLFGIIFVLSCAGLAVSIILTIKRGKNNVQNSAKKSA